LLDKIPFGAAFQKGLTFRMGQTHVIKYLKPLLDRIERGEIDPSFVITHRLPIEAAPDAYKTFRDKQDGCIKVVLKPYADTVQRSPLRGGSTDSEERTLFRRD
jgi:threonine dehydrogenase-like Zn-dependent dehydrogenase